jgi:hypothetical protein
MWIDVDPRKIGNKLDNVWVKPPTVLSSMTEANKPFVLVYVNNHGARRLIGEQLNLYGYHRGSDYLMVG